ncbi:MAG: hypothetical protein IT416_03925 [Candidatus Pacebacteria bacterium]|nr:hypothetical protein [Candidatus Paceibacterota bacterium]
MSPQVYKVKLADKEVLNNKFTRFDFELVDPHELEFLAGQYVSFLVSDKGERRSYSISSSPDIKHGFSITVDVTPAGLGVTFLNNLKFGDEAQVLGAMGEFKIQLEPIEEELVFIATGSGIAPFRSMVIDLLKNKQDQRKITLYWGLRHEEDMIWQDLFQDYAQTFGNFSFHPVLSQAQQEWPLCRGRVTDCLSIHDLPVKAGFYLCGNTAMIEDVKKVLLQRGVEQKLIHHEKFY